ncbi:response regulator transcription factor [Arcobacter sp. 15-2]|uniref:response regulator transcription factor n=1 Tax=Arcobacter sp. 15-2 TaxID=3374109 RepID=UPI00399CCD73
MVQVAMIEDDTELAEVLTQYLLTFNIQVTNYEDPFIGLSSIGLKKYDLIILDLTLPGLDGLEVCQELLKKHDIPIIISSARSDITDKVTALQLGADDYLPKPYDPRELEIRIKTILRRVNKTSQPKQIKKEKIFLYNEEKKVISKNNIALKLTPAEFEILALFIQREGFVISREDIFDNVHYLNSDMENSSSLSVIINRLRNKIEDNTKEIKYLQTIRGMGYKFVQ